MKINLNKREEWETHIFDKKGGMVSIWLGHIRGSFYGNFSYRDRHYNIFQKKRGFHLREEMFNFYLSLPFDWKKTIDSVLGFGKNEAKIGINLKTGDFNDKVLEVDEMSK